MLMDQESIHGELDRCHITRMLPFLDPLGAVSTDAYEHISQSTCILEMFLMRWRRRASHFVGSTSYPMQFIVAGRTFHSLAPSRQHAKACWFDPYAYLLAQSTVCSCIVVVVLFCIFLRERSHIMLSDFGVRATV